MYRYEYRMLEDGNAGEFNKIPEGTNPEEGLLLYEGEKDVFELTDEFRSSLLATEEYRKKRAWKIIRERRDFRLKETDWTQVADVPDGIKTKAKEYRKKLRDIPQDFDNPDEVVWPEKP